MAILNNKPHLLTMTFTLNQFRNFKTHILKQNHPGTYRKNDQPSVQFRVESECTQ